MMPVMLRNNYTVVVTLVFVLTLKQHLQSFLLSAQCSVFVAHFNVLYSPDLVGRKSFNTLDLTNVIMILSYHH